MRRILAVLVTLAIIGAAGWYWQRSLLPDAYSVMDMGTAADAEDAEHAGHGAHAPGTVSVTDLTGPQHGDADVSMTLKARAESFEVGDRTVEGYTLNGTSPGPTIRAEQGDLVEVRLVNQNVSDGVTLHWHGVNVPNAEDGVAGVTQDAVATGEEHVYRFVAEDAGTYWYHSHQVSHEQVRRGLLGALVIEPPDLEGTEVLALFHGYDDRRTINGRPGRQQIGAEPGSLLRVRVVNADNGPLKTWITGATYRVLAVDGQEVNEPEPVEDRHVVLGGGARLDLELRTPEDGSAVEVVLGSRASSLVLGSATAEPVGGDPPEAELDLLSYGAPADVGFDPVDVDRDYEYRIGRRFGLLDGRPGRWWTINGRMYPDVPMYMVSEGDVVRFTISNDSGEGHPMHLHGHHVLVLSRNGEPATGSPWWVDSLQVDDGDSFEVAFVADNPGVWMDHCHNLPHAVEGLMAHLAYDGVTTPYLVGGDAHNHPE